MPDPCLAGRRSQKSAAFLEGISERHSKKGRKMKSQDICEKITTAVIAELEKGVLPWNKPWAGNGVQVMPRRHNGLRYRGINIIILWGKAEEAGYRSPFWMTFKQALEYGANVRKGEKGTQIVYMNRVTKSEPNEAGEDIERSFGFLKSYTVFNVDQIENLPAQFLAPCPALVPDDKDWSAYAVVGGWFDAIPAEVRHGGDRACFIPSLDRIEMPDREGFFTPQHYFSVRAHETIHWTKMESRLNRDFGRVRWGDEGYAMEELVAELGAAFTMAELGMVPAIREDHAPYISHWLRVLKNDSKAILTAAAKASDALEYLSKFRGISEAEAEESACAEAA
ncbi:MAG: zincin-like metallopeptidase domain-containing protein [Acidocella sp.]|nr:zincin-like metallopeptidase domain-containing protein [Acidocella sp.]